MCPQLRSRVCGTRSAVRSGLVVRGQVLQTGTGGRISVGDALRSGVRLFLCDFGENCSSAGEFPAGAMHRTGLRDLPSAVPSAPALGPCVSSGE